MAAQNTETNEKIHLNQIVPIRFEDLVETPTTRDGYGITDVFTMEESDARYVRYDAPQTLTPEEQQQARDNIGISYPDSDHVHGIGNGTATVFMFGPDDVLNFKEGNNVTIALNPIDKSITINSTASGGTYTHPTQAPIDDTLTGKEVFSRIIVNALGHFTGYEIRTDLPYVDFTSDETITGLKTIRRAGANNGSSAQRVWGYEIGSDNLYKLYLMNSQNELSPAGEVNWFYRMTENYRNSPVDFDHIGFHRGGITALGGRLPSASISTDINTFIINDVTNSPYPISTYVHRSMMLENRLYAGKTNLTDTLFLSSIDRIYSSGKIYAAKGLRTPDPLTLALDGVTWYLGQAFESTNTTVNRYVEISINGVVYELLSRLKGTQPDPDPDPDPEISSVNLAWYIATSSLAITGRLILGYFYQGVYSVLTVEIPSGLSETVLTGNILVDVGTNVSITVENDKPLSPIPGPAISLEVETVTPSINQLYFVSSPPSQTEFYSLYVNSGTTYSVTAFISEDDVA